MLDQRKERPCVCSYPTKNAEKAGTRLGVCKIHHKVTTRALCQAALSREITECPFRSAMRASEIIPGLILPPLAQHCAQLTSSCTDFVHRERDCKEIHLSLLWDTFSLGSREHIARLNLLLALKGNSAGPHRGQQAQ